MPESSQEGSPILPGKVGLEENSWKKENLSWVLVLLIFIGFLNHKSHTFIEILFFPKFLQYIQHKVKNPATTLKV